MTPALDPKQGSFLKRGKYSGRWEDTENPERPKTEKSRFFSKKLNLFGRNLYFRGPEIEAHRSVSKFPNLDPFRHISSIIFNFFRFIHLSLLGWSKIRSKIWNAAPPGRPRKPSETRKPKEINRKSKKNKGNTYKNYRKERERGPWGPLGPNPLSFL